LKHNQLHRIDDADKPTYPMNGIIEFDAFGNHYKLWIRKHVELLHPNFVASLRNGDSVTYKTFENCHYIAEVISDTKNPSIAAFSVCKGRGMQGWIRAFNETIVVRPYKLLVDETYTGKHRIDDKHIVYKYQHLDRSDYPHNFGPTCAYSHEKTKILDERAYEKRKATYPDGLPCWRRTVLTSINIQRMLLPIIAAHCLIATWTINT